MRKLLIILFFSFFLSGCTIQGLFNKEPAGLTIKSDPPSTVFINGQNQGETPYKDEIKAGQYTIKLVPKSQDLNYPTWEKTFKLNPQVTTVISKTFAPVETESSSYVLELQPETNKQKTYLSVISDPDTASITLDGEPQGFTPITKKEVSPGDHSLEIASPGFKSTTIGLKTAKGYNLVVKAKLARETITLEQQEATDSAETATESAELETDLQEPTEQEDTEQQTDEIERPYVVIQETGTGWLRVRTKPNTTDSEEIGKVDVGETLKYLEANDTGWYKVIFEGQEGWLSGKYATLYR